MKKLILLAFPLYLIACNSKEEKPKPVEVPQTAMTQSSNSEGLNKSFALLLSNYYGLKDAFVKEDTAKIKSFATDLIKAADSLKLGDLKAEAALVETAKMNAQNVSDETKGLLGETNIENKRKSFQMVTSDVYDLLRVVKYDREIIYMQHCPMAFENKGQFNHLTISVNTAEISTSGGAEIFSFLQAGIKAMMEIRTRFMNCFIFIYFELRSI